MESSTSEDKMVVATTDGEQRSREELKVALTKLIEPYRTSKTPPPFPKGLLIIASIILSGHGLLSGQQILLWMLKTFPAYHDSAFELYSQVAKEPQRDEWRRSDQDPLQLPSGLQDLWAALTNTDLPLKCIQSKGCWRLGTLLKESVYSITTREARTAVAKYIEPERKGCFRFLDLPPELRNRIYEYTFNLGERQELAVFQTDDWNAWRRQDRAKLSPLQFQVHRRENGMPFHNPDEPDIMGRTQPEPSAWPGGGDRSGVLRVHIPRKTALASTCKQIRREGLPVFYGFSPLVFRSILPFLSWVAKFGGSIKYLAEVSITLKIDKKFVYGHMENTAFSETFALL